MSKKTRPVGRGTRNLTANVPNSLYAEVSKLTSVSGVRLGEFVRAILEYAVAHEMLVRKNPGDYVAWLRALENGESPLPKVRLEALTPAEIAMIKLPEKPTSQSAKKAS